MMLRSLEDKELILASGSPRRQQLLKDMGLDFKVIVPNVEESFPDDMPVREIAAYLAEKKASYFNEIDLKDRVVITSDTTVCLGDAVMNKPADREEAVNMIKNLSGNQHDVVSGVCIKTLGKTVVFSVTSSVVFNDLTDEEINHYVDSYKPMDKAGAYGIQEWIGVIGIREIQGSFYNVMGLPTHRLWEELKQF